MSATAEAPQAASGEEEAASLIVDSDAAALLLDTAAALDESAASSPLSEIGDDELAHGDNGDLVIANGDEEAVVKLERGAYSSDGRIALIDDHTTTTTPTTLRPDPPPSKKRRESEVDGATPELLGEKAHDDNNKKRKRGVSPPWHFPTAETTTLKTADGRRASARVNTGTPSAPSENDGRARSGSLAAPPTSRPRLESPPWRKFDAEGPTSLVVDGKRKSGRVNKELTDPPKRVSPRSKKVGDKGGGGSTAKTMGSSKALHAVVNASAHPKSPSATVKKPAVKESSRPPSASDSASKIAELRAQIQALKPSRSFQSPEKDRPTSSHKRKRSSTNNNNHHLPQHDGPTSPKTFHTLPSPALKSTALSPSTPHRPSPKIKLRFTGTRQPIPPPHPLAQPPSPIRPPNLSIFQALDQHELKELQAPYTENERGPPDLSWFLQRAEKNARDEAVLRAKILKEAEEPDGKLSRAKCSLFQDVEVQAEPAKIYTHHDYLVAHALHLRHLQLREKQQHRLLAKKVAHECLEKWKLKRGPTEEDLRLEQEKVWRLIFRQVVVDVKAKWELVGQYVLRGKEEVWRAEEEKRRKERLRVKLEWSENLVARLRGEDGEDEGGSSDDDGDGSDGESEEENMSESSESEDGVEEEDDGGSAADGEMGEEELRQYLALREAESQTSRHEDAVSEAPDEEDDEADVSMAEMLDSGVQSGHQTETEDLSMADLFGGEDEEGEADDPDHGFEPGDDAAPAEFHETEDHQTDTEHSLRRISRRSSTTPALRNEEGDVDDDLSSDESTNMDSTDYDSDEDMSSTGEEDNADDDEEDEGENEGGVETFAPKNSLLSLFKDELKDTTGLPTPTTSAEGDDGEGQADAGAAAAAVVDEEMMEDVAHEAAVAENEQTEAASVTAPESPAESIVDDDNEEDTASTKHLVPSPALLRGTLRSYQHTGLDWLAALYRNGTNGILADEMGLGKTIQTIALLAHLAEEHSSWDAHLIIVPTSVVLNWVTEFQRFLPGFRVLGYYGSSEERQLKRKGWVNDPHHENREKRGYNVVITSYNVAMQDINAIRNVQWHYLVLDEAHNIRNFNSQRWQVLIRLKTKARLLLTGTPLQNSLTELWSLLTFLTAGDDNPQHGDLEEFLSHWKEPVKEIFDRGVQTLSTEAQKVVDQLHISLRPFLLRRLKSEVEKDLPKKTESVVVCKLSKRQRQLYQEYMGLADTRKSLMNGNAVSAGKVLLSLRRVCNHPDLFDPRPVQTSWGMEGSVVEGFETKERVVRKLLGVVEMDMSAMVVKVEGKKKYAVKRARQLDAVGRLEREVDELEIKIRDDVEPDATTLLGCQALQRARLREKKLEHLRSCIRISKDSLQASPVYGSDLRELLTIQHDRAYRIVAKDIRGRVIGRHLRGWPALGRRPLKFETEHVADWMLAKSSLLQQSAQTAEKYAERLQETLVRFAFCTPAVTAPILDYTIPNRAQQVLRASDAYPTDFDYAHEARIRSSIVFPDSRLLVYDAGKLQRLTLLLRELQSRGSRSLIFTQMTGTLNILEQFLNLLNLPYLRLDGSTPVERRQLYSAEFNRPDSRYQCMILSSRAGGVGLNLTGASSVIFYDLDWNPQMDRQCMDRAHRIGQVRDVEVYKMVSEKTVEENILLRASQKSLLDQTVIQEGRFTTEYQLTRHDEDSTENDGDDDDDDDAGADVAAAIERFLGGGNEKVTNQALESVEDREDVQAAQQARKEEHQDDADFAERSSKGPSGPPTPGHFHHHEDGVADGDGNDDEERKGHLDYFMIRHMEFLLKDVPFVPPLQKTKKTDRRGRDAERRKRKR